MFLQKKAGDLVYGDRILWGGGLVRTVEYNLPSQGMRGTVSNVKFVGGPEYTFDREASVEVFQESNEGSYFSYLRSI